MAKCPFCNHFNRTDATECEECRAPLQTVPSGSDATPPAAAPEPGSLESEILGLMQGQQKIKAIKLYRDRTGAGLKEAKDFVETLAAKHGVAPSTGGCAGMVLLMLLAGAAATGAAWTLAVL